MPDPTELQREVRGLLWRAGPAGITARELSRRSRPFRRLTQRGRTVLLDRMAAARQCVPVQTRRTVAYVDADYLIARGAP